MKAYEKSGVSIKKGNLLVSKIKPLAKSTFTPEVLSEIGHFGGFYNAEFLNYKKPVLISSVDGVGTKLKVAIGMDRHNTIGQDLVNHCVNDILCAGAKPLFFLDYLAFGKLNVDVAEKIISGFAKACRENSCSLIGGETAEMPKLYKEDEYDISGTIVGVVDYNKIVDGKKIKSGNLIIGLPSNGLHTNGYSLARKVLLKKYKLTDKPSGLRLSMGNELLRIHKSYFHQVYPLIDKIGINGISHITGGGIVGNTKRILPKNLKLNIDWKSWKIPPLFKLIQEVGKISDEEMREVFNLGIGMILIVDKRNAGLIMNELELKNEKPIVIGEIQD